MIGLYVGRDPTIEFVLTCKVCDRREVVQQMLSERFVEFQRRHADRTDALIRDLARIAPASGKHKTVLADEVRRARQEALL